jgi:TrwC relaxase
VGSRRTSRCGADRKGPPRRDQRRIELPRTARLKVQTLDGRWLSIDGRILFKATVAASETYNTALEHHLRDSLGLKFAERPGRDPRKQPLREIVGVHPALITRWSTRRTAIEARHSVLSADFQSAHGRPPTPVEALQLAQQATLETREAKTPTTQPRRATKHLVRPSRRGAGRARRHPSHGAGGAQPFGIDGTGAGCWLARRSSGSGAIGDGGTPFHLADLACTRRGATLHSSRRRADNAV